MTRRTLVLSLFLLVFSLAFLPSRAALAIGDATITAIYMVADAAVPGGYREVLRWQIPPEDQWARLHNNVATFKKRQEHEVNPFLNREGEIIVLVQNDSNRITGEDFYLSPRGIMRVARTAQDQYYSDDFHFRQFLDEELKNRVHFEALEKNPVSPNAPGIVATMNLSDTAISPIWNVTAPKDITLYESFLKRNTPMSSGEVQMQLYNSVYDKPDNYLVYFNYEGAPTRMATVTDGRIRLSNITLRHSFYEDPDGYYAYFAKYAHNKTMNDLERAQKEQRDKLRRQF